MVNATWTVADALSVEALDTETEGEYFVAGTPIGAVFGSNGPSLSTNFLKVESPNDTTTDVVITVTFASAVPAGQLGFAVSDLDSDHVTVEATDASGALLTGEQLKGTASPTAFNFCDYSGAPCSNTDVPTITTNPTSVLTQGPNTGSDGSTAWFQPNVAVKSVIFTYRNDDVSFSSTSRYWFAQTAAEAPPVPPVPATLAVTGMNSSFNAGLMGVGLAFATAASLFVIRRRHRA